MAKKHSHKICENFYTTNPKAPNYAAVCVQLRQLDKHRLHRKNMDVQTPSRKKSMSLTHQELHKKFNINFARNDINYNHEFAMHHEINGEQLANAFGQKNTNCNNDAAFLADIWTPQFI